MKGVEIRDIVVEGFVWERRVGEGISTKESGVAGGQVKEIKVLGIEGWGKGGERIYSNGVRT